MKRWRPLLLAACAALLAACGDSSGNAAVENVVAYLNALNAGDVEEALSYVCDERKEAVREGLETTSDAERADFEFQNIQCAYSGGEVNCTYVIVQDEQTADVQSTQSEQTVTFQIDGDGKICGESIDE